MPIDVSVLLNLAIKLIPVVDELIDRLAAESGKTREEIRAMAAAGFTEFDKLCAEDLKEGS